MFILIDAAFEFSILIGPNLNALFSLVRISNALFLLVEIMNALISLVLISACIWILPAFPGVARLPADHREEGDRPEVRAPAARTLRLRGSQVIHKVTTLMVSYIGIYHHIFVHLLHTLYFVQGGGGRIKTNFFSPKIMWNQNEIARDIAC